jgi:NitT/TauT family transport system substrate-binding protein
MPKHALRALLVILAVAVGAFALAACGSDDDSSTGTAGTAGSDTTAAASGTPAQPESGTFRMGIEPWLGYGPWRIAESEGIFEDNGLDVEITNFETDDQINAAFAAGKLDGTNIATHTALRFAASGLPIKIVLLEDQSLEADAILAHSDVGSIQDLAGKSVAFEEGTTSDILLSYALAQNDMTKSDIKVVPLAAANAGAAFIAGKVDAAVTYEPYLTTALKEDPGAKLLYTAGEDPGLVSDVFVVSQDTLDQKPGQIAALVKSWGQAVDAYNADKPASQAIIEKSVGADPGDLKTAFKGVKFYSLAENRDELGGAFADQVLEDVKQSATDAGLLEGDVDAKSLIVASFVDEAAK